MTTKKPIRKTRKKVAKDTATPPKKDLSILERLVELKNEAVLKREYAVAAKLREAEKEIKKIEEQTSSWNNLADDLVNSKGFTIDDPNTYTYHCDTWFWQPDSKYTSGVDSYKTVTNKSDAEKQVTDWQRREIATKFAGALLSNPKTANCRMNIVKRVVYYLLGIKRQISIYPAMVAGAAISTTDELLKQLKTKQ